MTWVDATLAKSRFPYIVVHETSHQWFYGGDRQQPGARAVPRRGRRRFPDARRARPISGSHSARSRASTSRSTATRAAATTRSSTSRAASTCATTRTRSGQTSSGTGMHQFWMDRKFEIASTRELPGPSRCGVRLRQPQARGSIPEPLLASSRGCVGSRSPSRDCRRNSGRPSPTDRPAGRLSATACRAGRHVCRGRPRRCRAVTVSTILFSAPAAVLTLTRAPVMRLRG